MEIRKQSNEQILEKTRDLVKKLEDKEISKKSELLTIFHLNILFVTILERMGLNKKEIFDKLHNQLLTKQTIDNYHRILQSLTEEFWNYIN